MISHWQCLSIRVVHSPHFHLYKSKSKQLNVLTPRSNLRAFYSTGLHNSLPDRHCTRSVTGLHSYLPRYCRFLQWYSRTGLPLHLNWCRHRAGCSYYPNHISIFDRDRGHRGLDKGFDAPFCFPCCWLRAHSFASLTSNSHPKTLHSSCCPARSGGLHREVDTRRRCLRCRKVKLRLCKTWRAWYPGRTHLQAKGKGWMRWKLSRWPSWLECSQRLFWIRDGHASLFAATPLASASLRNFSRSDLVRGSRG